MMETTIEQFIETHIRRAGLGTFLVFVMGGGWDDEAKTLAEMWTDETRDKYKVTVTVDCWDKPAGIERKSFDTQGTIVIDGFVREWRLLPNPEGGMTGTSTGYFVPTGASSTFSSSIR
jgi:hypothetical protein